MFGPILTHRLTVSINPVDGRAAVEVQAPGFLEPHAVIVEPAPGNECWLGTDPTDPEPTWRPTFAEAIGEAIAHASGVLEDRIVRGLAQPGPGVAEPVVGGADIC